MALQFACQPHLIFGVSGQGHAATGRPSPSFAGLHHWLCRVTQLTLHLNQPLCLWPSLLSHHILPLPNQLSLVKGITQAKAIHLLLFNSKKSCCKEKQKKPSVTTLETAHYYYQRHCYVVHFSTPEFCTITSLAVVSSNCPSIHLATSRAHTSSDLIAPWYIQYLISRWKMGLGVPQVAVWVAKPRKPFMGLTAIHNFI